MCMYCMYLLVSMLVFDWNTVHWVCLNYVLLLFSSPKRAIKRNRTMIKMSERRLSDHYSRAHLAIWITHPLDLLKKSHAADFRSGFCWSMTQPITLCCLKITTCHQYTSPHLILISTCNPWVYRWETSDDSRAVHVWNEELDLQSGWKRWMSRASRSDSGHQSVLLKLTCLTGC